jgi:molybdenum cofactor synthesis domain-containing protein
MSEKTAAILAIGDELLSGRTRDANLHFLAGWLTERAVNLREARIVPDDFDAIAGALNALRAKYDYVFTSGGIGPTHDDITVDAIARALGVDVIVHPEAKRMIVDWYKARGEDVTDARLRMARTPDGAELIKNAASGAPGVRIGNIFVLAGVPRIFQTMLDAIEPEIEGGDRIFSKAVTVRNLPESTLAAQLLKIQTAENGVSIGSYPIDGDVKGVTIIVRSTDIGLIDRAIKSVCDEVASLGYEAVDGDHHG